MVLQHVPVERCRGSSPTWPVLPCPRVHPPCLAKAASLPGEGAALIRTLITASAVAGFDETTLRSGPAGEKKYIHGASPSGLGVLAGHPQPGRHGRRWDPPGFAGIVVSDRYQN